MKRKLKHITVSGLIIFAICLVIFLRASGKKAKADQREESSLRPVAVALVTRVPLVNTLTLSGAFRPYQEVDVHAKIGRGIVLVVEFVHGNTRAELNPADVRTVEEAGGIILVDGSAVVARAPIDLADQVGSRQGMRGIDVRLSARAERGG